MGNCQNQAITMNQKLIASQIFCLLLIPFFFIGGPDHYSSESYKYAWNFGHPLFFAIANFVLLTFLFQSKRLLFWQRGLVAFFFTMVSGLAIELQQSNFSRQVSLEDIFRNFLGTGIAIFFLAPRMTVNIGLWCKLGCKTGQLLSLAGLLYMLLTLAQLLNTEQRYKNQLPLLFGFEEIEDLTRIGGSASTELSGDYVAQGELALKIMLTPQRYSGISLKKMPGDWRPYHQLVLSFYNPSKHKLPITLRINDLSHSRKPKGYHDRFNRHRNLPPGWTHWQIPLSEIAQAPKQRKLDLSSISGVGIFTSGLQIETPLYLDNVQLLKFD
jgi:VanZ family protein